MTCYFAVSLKLLICSSSELPTVFPEINLVFLSSFPGYCSFAVKWPGELAPIQISHTSISFLDKLQIFRRTLGWAEQLRLIRGDRITSGFTVPRQSR